MQLPLSEKNFRPLTSTSEFGYTILSEIGDLVQGLSTWRDQVIRVTLTEPKGDLQWKIFRGAKARSQANKWLNEITSGLIKTI